MKTWETSLSTPYNAEKTQSSRTWTSRNAAMINPYLIVFYLVRRDNNLVYAGSGSTADPAPGFRTFIEKGAYDIQDCGSCVSAIGRFHGLLSQTDSACRQLADFSSLWKLLSVLMLVLNYKNLPFLFQVMCSALAER